MPQGPPPPYAGELCRNAEDGEEHDLEISRLGRYYGLCGHCRVRDAQRRAEQRAAKQAGMAPKHARADMDGMRDEIVARAQQKPKLRRACEHLTEQAILLEEAIGDRDAATLHAGVVLSQFKEALQQVSRTAQSMLNGSRQNGD